MPDPDGTAGERPDRFAQAIALYQAGRDSEALVECEAARETRPDDARLWQLTGVLLSRLERSAEATDALARAVELEPDDAALRFQHASLLMQLGRNDEACNVLAALVAIAPDHVEALRALGALRNGAGDLDGAVAAYESLLRLRPDDTHAWTNLGWCHAGRHEYGHSEACLRRAAVISPNSASAHVAHAKALRSVGDPEAALAVADRAVELAPDSAAAHDARAGALRDLGRTVEGLASIERAFVADPEYAPAFLHAGLLLHDAGEAERAVQAFDRALQLQPENVDAHWNRGTALLALGRFEAGFAEYEWRFRSPLFYRGKPRHAQPRWDGAALSGRRLLVHAEQGLGDTIQFLRYLACLSAQDADFDLEVQPVLLPLVRESGLARSVFGTGEALPSFDVRASIMSLPHLLQVWPGDPALPMPYLQAAPARVEKWARRLDGLPWPRVGLCWRGNPNHPQNHLRSMALRELKPLFEEPITFVSLQQADVAAEIANEELLHTVEDWSREMDRDGAFLDTAALMMSLDCVVTVDTSIAHLAGALGRPVMLLLNRRPDFRWMLGRGDTPWYPSMTLLRQQRAGDWSGPIDAVRKALWRMVANG
jgi:tetratricopeptide (TPR) repeat protein